MHHTTKYKPFTRNNIHLSSVWSKIPDDIKEATKVISTVLPFRTNEYVLSELIDWDKVPDDPIFRLTFPSQDMFSSADYGALHQYMVQDNKTDLERFVGHLRMKMNPHPAGQMTHNVPMVGEKLLPLPGVQHKYKETVLFFPTAGQTCHAYCTFCFRWAQFVGIADMKFNAKSSNNLVDYLKGHKQITDILITGGDPLIMNTRSLSQYIEPLLSPDLNHIQTIRIGSKAMAYWPQRFTSDADADDLIRLFERIITSGKHLAIMAHYNHSVELHTPVAQMAIKRILATGAVIRMQSPLIKHINDNVDALIKLWTLCVKLGVVPYYMFVERDTGPKDYFSVSLADAYHLFTEAYKQVSGLARTIRGPTMSAFPGKVMIDGIVELSNKKYFALQFLQARNPDWVRKPFYAQFDPHATWLNDLKPAFGQEHFFFEHA